MTTITVLTTFHQEGLDVYGQRFLDSFAKNIDKRIKLLVYAEDCTPINPDPDQITILDAVEALPKLVAFKEKWGDVPKANGIPPDDIKARRPRDWHKEFKWDAVRFANKTYAVYDAVTRSKDWCVWMDADTFVHSSWSYDDFVAQLPSDSWITYVGRGKGSQTWPECGFYGLNLHNDTCKQCLFVNCMNTTSGGKHVDYVVDQIKETIAALSLAPWCRNSDVGWVRGLARGADGIRFLGPGSRA